jgi:hypothetical protein
MMDAGIWEIRDVQRVNRAADFRLERNYSEGLMKEPTRNGLEGTLRKRGKVKVRGVVGC